MLEKMLEKILGKMNENYNEAKKSIKGYSMDNHEPERFGAAWERRKKHFFKKAWYRGSGITSASARRTAR